MYLKVIIPFIINLAQNKRISTTLSWYLIMLILPLDKHTQANAAKISKKDNSLFSNLLSTNINFSKQVLNRAVRRNLKRLAKNRKKIFRNEIWSIVIIIDATLHKRSSRHTSNSQVFNHGKGYIVGHQWTNIGIMINNQFIPLPPIPFYTRKECKIRKISYETEHEKVSKYIKYLSLKTVLGMDIDPSEVVLLLDSGYDCKSIQEAILSRKWDFVSSIRSRRSVSNKSRGWINILRYFQDGRRPFKSVRIKSYRGKKVSFKKYSYKQQVGYLKDIHSRVMLVCSKRVNDKKCKFLACSNINVSIKNIILCYKLRWTIEIFHRDIKSYLGMEDAGVKRFDSLHNHVHWVYLAYILLKEKYPKMSIRAAQIAFEREGRIKEIKTSNQKLTQINGFEKLRISNLSVIREIEMLNAA